MPGSLEADKRAMRAEIRERRQHTSDAQRATETAAFTERLDELVATFGARTITCYLSTPTEPGTRPFIKAAAARGLRVLLPVTRPDGLLDWTVATSGAEEELGEYGVPEPTGELLGPMAADDADLLIIPAAAIAHDGMRLGWGRGYFDKMLGSIERCPPTYAMIFDPEFVEAVPREPHDRPVNGIVTPTRTLGLDVRR